MKIATFGTIKFVVSSSQVITFSELSRTSSINTEDIDNGKKKQKIGVKSIAADDLSFSVLLTNDNVNVKKQYDAWIKLMEDKVPYYLIIGKSSYGKNKWLLTNVSISDQTFLRNGVIKSAKVSLSFKEYTGKAKSTTAKATRNTNKK